MELLLRIFIDPDIEADEGIRLLFDAGHLGWLYFLIIALVGAFCVWTYRRIRTPISRRSRTLLIATRVALLIVLFLLLLRPSIHYSAQKTPIVAVVVDVSASMDASDPASDEDDSAAVRDLIGDVGSATTTRVQIAAAAVERLGEHLGEDPEAFDVRIYTFDEELRSVAAVGSTARGVSTDIAGAMHDLAHELRGEPLLATVVLSDGVHNRGGELQAPLRFFAAREVPIYAVGLGGTIERPDVRLTAVHAPTFAFLESQIRVEATVAWEGSVADAGIELWEGDTLVERQSVPREGERGTARVEFQLDAETAGKHFYRVVVPPQEGEASSDNNERSFSVEVLETFRLLYVTATPRPEFAFLRRFLETDCRIQVTTLLAAAGERGRFLNRSTKAADRTLTRFPETAEELSPFQVVVFGDIERQRFQPRQLELLRDEHVGKGGGFLMIGGEHTFGSGGYEGSPIAEILPVVVRDGEGQEATAFVPLLTDLGRASPLLQSRAFEAPEFGWDELPAFGGLNVVAEAKPSARVLAVHPSESNSAGPWVVLATAEYGQGRTMALTVDETWRWFLQNAHEETNPAQDFYRDFWSQVARWLGVPPDRPGLRIVLPKKDVAVHEEVQLEVRLLDDDLEPITGVTPKLTVQVDGGEERAVALAEEAPGRFVSRIDTKRAGSLRLRAAADDPRRGALRDEEVLTIRPPSVELERTARDGSTLATLGRASGGAYTELAGIEGIAQRIERLEVKGRRRFRRVGEAEVWDAWSLLVLLIALLGLEWSLRRKAGIL